VATHDDTLCALEGESSVRAINIHFTDVMVANEMTFDYKLRPGRATTSNALRLLELAGIPVPSLVSADGELRSGSRGL
jgi:DNA mismatch repair ATPase MutS